MTFILNELCRVSTYSSIISFGRTEAKRLSFGGSKGLAASVPKRDAVIVSFDTMKAYVAGIRHDVQELTNFMHFKILHRLSM